MSQSLNISHVVKYYGDFKAIDDVSIEIKPGEFFTLLGPSGCGKTTLLRMIAGFNTIEEGNISFDSKIINAIPAYKRNIGMVFQNYAIFPHLSVFENVAYGLKARKISNDEIKRRVDEVLELVKMSEYADRSPQQLSGGQQQRVALARAIVIEPAVLLMDEPLSNLDAKLRIEMRTVIKKIQNQLGITTVYVTHDQQEALAISDRIAVMNKGEIQQIGSPHEIYVKPANAFVAGFIGITNFIKCDIKYGVVEVGGTMRLHMALKNDYSGHGILSVRPEQISLVSPRNDLTDAEIQFSTFLGDFINYEVKLPWGQVVQVNEYIKDCHTLRNIGDSVGFKFEESRLRLFVDEGQKELELCKEQ